MKTEDMEEKKPGQEKPENGQQPGGAGEETRAEQRIKSVLSEKEEAEKKAKAAEDARVAAEQKAAEATFRADFAEISGKYPHAAEFKADIEAKVKAGVPLEDAAVAVLHGKGKLVTREEVDRDKNDANAFGGSAGTRIDPDRSGGRKDLSKMTQDEKLAEIRRLESIGEIGLEPS